MTKKHNLLICPECQEQGKTHVLGELEANGDFLIKRDRNTIRIRALHLQVICDQCSSVVFVRYMQKIARTALYADLFTGGVL